MADNEPKGYGRKFKDMVIAVMDYVKENPVKAAAMFVAAAVVMAVIL